MGLENKKILQPTADRTYGGKIDKFKFYAFE